MGAQYYTFYMGHLLAQSFFWHILILPILETVSPFSKMLINFVIFAVFVAISGPHFVFPPSEKVNWISISGSRVRALKFDSLSVCILNK